MVDEPIDVQTDDVVVKSLDPKPPNGNGGHPDTITESVRKAREMIPVGDRGVTPQTYAQWVDVAKDVCKAYLMLPSHLHDNPSVVAGLLEIAARFRLSPYMLASKTYVQGGRLCFESQAFGALLYASGLLMGRLRYEFKGEGDDMTCTATGRFRDDPDVWHSATTPPLKQLHPGMTQKDGKTYVKGSPLWDKDPEQQMAYFAQRRWTRRYAPDCVAGMYTREEIDEIDEYRVDHGGSIPLTADRVGQLDTGEGWGDGAHLDLDLASIAPERPAETETETEAEPPPAAATAKPARGRKAARKAQPATPPAKTHPAKARRQPPTKAQITAVVNRAVGRAEKPAKKATAPLPKWLDYVTSGEAWIKTVSTLAEAELADGRWESERDHRDKVQVPMGERSRLRALLDRKIAALKPPKKEDDET